MAPEGRHAGWSKKQDLESCQEPRMSSLALVFFLLFADWLALTMWLRVCSTFLG